jgi:hypothetical protein
MQYREVKSLELESVKRRVERWCEMAASLEVSWSCESFVGYSPVGEDVSRQHYWDPLLGKHWQRTEDVMYAAVAVIFKFMD